MTEGKTAQEKYDEIVAEFPDFESAYVDTLEHELSAFLASEPVLKICRAGPEVFDYWLTKISHHEMRLRSLYHAYKKSQKDMAAAGAAVWNYWQRIGQRERIPQIDGQSLLNAGISHFSHFHFLGEVIFAKANFSEKVDFSGVIFSKKADFKGAVFSDEVSFDRVIFSDEADFEGVTFSQKASFQGARFSRKMSFREVTFSRAVSFNGVTFSRSVSFRGVIFSQAVSFAGVEFSDPASFEGVQFSHQASFSRVEFSHSADFQRAKFSEDAYFSRAIFSAEANFRRVKFADTANFTAVDFAFITDFDDAIFSGEIDFTKSRFEDSISFRDAKFGSLTNFTGCIFSGGPPICHGASIHQDTRFLGAEWPTDKGLNQEASRYEHKGELLAEWKSSYRTFKLAFAQHQSVREEQEFGRLEMEMDRHLMRHLGKWGQAVYLTLYGKLADYGYSAQRPALWLLGLFAVGCCVAFWAKDCSVSEALKLSLAYTLPPFVLATEFPDTGYWFAWFAPQRLLSYLLLFLIALAWRNRAKSK